MEHLDLPTREHWESRREWFERLAAVEDRWGGYIVSEQALGLLVELQAVFCAGAWVAVLILAASVIDAHARDVEAPGLKGGFKQSFAATGLADELEWLRQRRNALVHFSEGQVAVTVDDHWSRRAELEREARRAVELVFKVMYQWPSV